MIFLRCTVYPDFLFPQPYFIIGGGCLTNVRFSRVSAQYLAVRIAEHFELYSGRDAARHLQPPSRFMNIVLAEAQPDRQSSGLLGLRTTKPRGASF